MYFPMSLIGLSFLYSNFGCDVFSSMRSVAKGSFRSLLTVAKPILFCFRRYKLDRSHCYSVVVISAQLVAEWLRVTPPTGAPKVDLPSSAPVLEGFLIINFTKAGLTRGRPSRRLELKFLLWDFKLFVQQTRGQI